MDANELFKTALGLQPPWEVAALDFDLGKRRLDIRVDFQKGSFFPCPVCGKPSKAHDTEERTWRHLDFFQHAAYLTARVPRCDCDEHGIKTVDVPWARKGSGFTLMFEGLIMILVREMTVNAIARLVGGATRIWRVLDHHVDRARAKQFSKVQTITIDEKSYRQGHRCVTFVMDLDLRRLLFRNRGARCGHAGGVRGDLICGGEAEQIKMSAAIYRPSSRASGTSRRRIITTASTNEADERSPGCGPARESPSRQA
jgi:hypothetical protein